MQDSWDTFCPQYSLSVSRINHFPHGLLPTFSKSSKLIQDFSWKMISAKGSLTELCTWHFQHRTCIVLQTLLSERRWSLEDCFSLWHFMCGSFKGFQINLTVNPDGGWKIVSPRFTEIRVLHYLPRFGTCIQTPELVKLHLRCTMAPPEPSFTELRIWHFPCMSCRGFQTI